MIPAHSEILQDILEIEESPTATYFMDIDSKYIRGDVDNIEAMRQAVYKILNTERYEYVIYGQDYGVQFKDLIGMPSTYVIPELERRVREALIWDNRITEVNNFKFNMSGRHTVTASFNVATVYGDFLTEREVNF